MGKNIKSYATTQVHSPGEGREALRQKVQIFWQNMVRFAHSFPNLQAKFFKFMFCISVKIYSELCTFVSKFTGKIFQIHVLYFGQITANYANSAQFAPNILHHLLNTLCFRYHPGR